MDVSRRQFFKICAGGMAGTTVAALGFAPKQALAQARKTPEKRFITLKVTRIIR